MSSKTVSMPAASPPPSVRSSPRLASAERRVDEPANVAASPRLRS
ncbi:MAG: hypothetical protein ACK55Z_35030 [bacterium]